MHPRYTDPTIERIWSRQSQIRIWADIETEWLRQHTEAGWLDARAARIPTAAELDERERTVHHEFVAFLELWTEGLRSDEAARWVHYGLTSSDVIDTGTALVLERTHLYLDSLASELVSKLSTVADSVADLPQVGRTHGQWAQPRPADIPLLALWSMAMRGRARMGQVGQHLGRADFSGPTGGSDGLDPDKVLAALHHLGLAAGGYSTQILPRDTWVWWAHSVAHLVTICEAVAEHYWLLAQSEIAEVEVVHGAGSSAMPHKRGNPHRAENVRGLARLARALVSSLDESMVQRGDRDLAHSSVERVALPDLAHLAATAFTRTIEILDHYPYAREQVQTNLERAVEYGADSTSRMLVEIQSGSTRAQAITNTRKEHQ